MPEEIAPAAEVVPAVPAEEVPDWLKAVEAEIPEVDSTAVEAAPIEAAPAAEAGLPAGLDLTDQDAALAWLEGLAAKQGVPEEELITKPEERAEIPSIEEVQAPEVSEAVAAPAEELPEWMKEIETEAVTPTVEAVPAVPAEEVPDWLKAAEAEVPEEIAPAVEAAPIEAAPAAESGLPAGLDLTDQDAALAWLEGLAAKQGVPEEELITKPEERAEVPSIGEVQAPEVSEAVALPAEELPEWMKEIETEAVTTTVEAVPAAPAEEAPDWLKAAEAEVSEEIAPIAEALPAVPAEEVPDWLKAAEAEIPEELPPTVEAAPIEAAPAAEI